MIAINHLLAALVFCCTMTFLGYLLGLRLAVLKVRKVNSKIPTFDPPPPPPPRKGKTWYRLQVHELKPGEVYRDRLTGWPVRVRKAGTQPKEGQSHYMTARGELVNRVTGVREPIDIWNDDLETDNIGLAPRAMQQFERALMEPRPIISQP